MGTASPSRRGRIVGLPPNDIRDVDNGAKVWREAGHKYVDTRATDNHRGKPINPLTIKKEVATLKYVWNWANRLSHFAGRCPATEVVFPKSKHKEPFRTFDQIRAIVTRGGQSKTAIRSLWDGLDLNPPQIAELLEHIRQRNRHS